MNTAKLTKVEVPRGMSTYIGKYMILTFKSNRNSVALISWGSSIECLPTPHREKMAAHVKRLFAKVHKMHIDAVDWDLGAENTFKGVKN